MKTLVLGTCCIDMVLNVERIPHSGTDLNADDLSLSMGGMAYNVYQAIKYTGEDAILGSPAGEGFFSDIILKFYHERGVEPFAREKGTDNGVCLCLVDRNGERTFVAYHGAEYLFRKEWYEGLDFSNIGMIYFSGLEVEEPTGEDLISFVEEKKIPALFAPSSRVVGLSRRKLQRIYELHPIIHVNEYEAEYMGGTAKIPDAAEMIFRQTNAPVIVTLGEAGAYVRSGEFTGPVETVPVDPARIVDTIGAGDAHAGSFIAGLMKGYGIEQAVRYANKLAGTVLTHAGAGIV